MASLEAFLESVHSPDRSASAFLASLEPEEWVAGGYEAASPVELKATPAWWWTIAQWLDWSVANTPARPSAGAAPLEEVREREVLFHSAGGRTSVAVAADGGARGA